jgi:hypothetical protein
MEIRAYAHPYHHIDCHAVAGWDDRILAGVSVQLLYHMAADLDDQARAVERDCSTAQYATEIRAELIALLDSLGLYPDRLAELREIQRIELHNWGIGRRMQREHEVQQARVQWAILQKDPRRYAVYEG